MLFSSFLIYSFLILSQNMSFALSKRDLSFKESLKPLPSLEKSSLPLATLFPSLQDSVRKNAQNKKQSLIRSQGEYFSLEKNKRYKISLPTSKESKGEKKEERISNTTPLFDTKNKPLPKSSISLSGLNSFFQTKSALEIHNKALQLLKSDQKAPALLLLEKNFYHNFFLPSFALLSHLKAPLFFSPFLWHALLFFMSGLCLMYSLLALKKQNLNSLKKLILIVIFHLACLGLGPLALKSRVSPLQKIELKSAPFDSAAVSTEIRANAHLLVLKKAKGWLRVQSLDKQSGWAKKQDLFQIF